MQFMDVLAARQFALSEGSMYERLRRHGGISLDPFLYHAVLVYSPSDRLVLQAIHREYLDVGQEYRLPMFALTDTWRANQERIDMSVFRGRPVNEDNARFLIDLRADYGPNAAPIFIGGQIGPRGDAYTPEEALGPAEAEQFHRPQLEALAGAGVDFLYAATLPALTEAEGIARAMSRLGLPYVLSFVIRGNGALLDGTPLDVAMTTIDDATEVGPAGFAVNCVHPATLIAGLDALDTLHPDTHRRIVSFQANTSARDPKELDGLSELETEEPEILAELMVRAHERFGIPFMGGCCGTSTRHIAGLAQTYQALQ